MLQEPVTSILTLALPLADTLDLVSPLVMNHHRKVAFIAYRLGAELGLPLERKQALLLSGLFHDIGALSQKERLDSLSFEIKSPHQHAETGYQLLRDFPPFTAAAAIIRFHHVHWDDGSGQWHAGYSVPPESHIIHLADRIAVLLPGQPAVLDKAPEICREIRRLAGTWFHPDAVAAFENLAGKEYFWLDAASPSPTEQVRFIAAMEPVELGSAGIQDLTRLFSRVIDFRSAFTATHSSGVAACAEALAGLAGFSKREILLMRSAGHLHDLGKMAVPTNILEKNGKLTPAEYNIMRTHTYFGFRALQKIPLLETVNLWGSLHHERLDGSGYPFHLPGDDIPLGSRIMAVADVFTALAEDRPYRQGFPHAEALGFLAGMVKDGLLDGNIVDLLEANLTDVGEAVRAAAGEALGSYRRVVEQSRTG
jgi:HD-GYP domain